jgi:hypothetical protein
MPLKLKLKRKNLRIRRPGVVSSTLRGVGALASGVGNSASALANAFGAIGLNQERVRTAPRKRALFANPQSRAAVATIQNFPSGRTTKPNQSHLEVNDEYIGEINGTTSFACTAYAVNPGQIAIFPWLYKLAALYEKYRFEMLEFYYKPEVSQYATNGQAGKVMLSFDFDSSDPPPTIKQQVEDTYPHADGMPYETIRLNLDPKELSNFVKMHYVRTASLPGGSDIKTYDVGNLNVCTTGNTNTSVLGELRVRYSCRLDVPILQSVAIAPKNYSMSSFTTQVANTAPVASYVSGLTANAALEFATIISVNGPVYSISQGVFGVTQACNLLASCDATVFELGGTLQRGGLTLYKNATCLVLPKNPTGEAQGVFFDVNASTGTIAATSLSISNFFMSAIPGDTISFVVNAFTTGGTANYGVAAICSFQSI